MSKFELLCYSCKKCRRLVNGGLVCLSIGNPELTFIYGNQCKRYEESNKPLNISDNEKQ